MCNCECEICSYCRELQEIRETKEYKGLRASKGNKEIQDQLVQLDRQEIRFVSQENELYFVQCNCTYNLIDTSLSCLLSRDPMELQEVLGRQDPA